MARATRDVAGPRWNWRLWVGLAGVLIVAGLAVASLLYQPPPLAYPKPGEQWLLPGPAHWLGTDGAGRELTDRLLASSLTSVGGAGGAVLLGLLLALPLAFAMAAGPRAVGWISAGAAGLLLPLTPLVVAIIGTACLGQHTGIMVVAIGLFHFGQLSRLTRAALRRRREASFVVAAQLAGAARIGIARVHLLPDIFPTIVMTAIRQFGIGVLWEATLSFLGFGVPPLRASVGLVLADAQAAPVVQLWPVVLVGLYLGLTMLTCRLLADGAGRHLRSASTAIEWQHAAA
jgi:peptide/nickel transport system permease protein